MSEVMWSPQLVEELLFREFMKGEDVDQFVPRPKSVGASEAAAVAKFNESIAAMDRYFEVGPTVLHQHNTNMGPTSVCHGLPPRTPRKGALQSARTPPPQPLLPPPPPQSQQGKPPASPPPGGSVTPPKYGMTPRRADSKTPRQKERAPSGSPPPQSPRIQQVPTKKLRVEWPSGIPTNADLRGKARQELRDLAVTRIQAQSTIDPDLFFVQPKGEFPLMEIFKDKPLAAEALSKIRGATGDWALDTFDAEEERLYKQAVGFTSIGPSQCSLN